MESPDPIGKERISRELLEDLLYESTISGEDEEAGRMAEAVRILAGSESRDCRHIDDMISAGGCTSAAIALLPGDAGFLLSRGRSGANLASVSLALGEADVSAQASTPALALVAAYAAALIAETAGGRCGPLGREDRPTIN
ncbi:hypothetical protein GCM10011371_30710 [Novosphingobium marinum]|nr:hypothetical protein GCM10011371_30710 [Novosphingobium marinum]